VAGSKRAALAASETSASWPMSPWMEGLHDGTGEGPDGPGRGRAVFANSARGSANAARAAHPLNATAAQTKAAQASLVDHALLAGFSRGFEVSAGIMLLALIVTTVMIRVTRQDLAASRRWAPDKEPDGETNRAASVPRTADGPAGHPGRAAGWLGLADDCRRASEVRPSALARGRVDLVDRPARLRPNEPTASTACRPAQRVPYREHDVPRAIATAPLSRRRQASWPEWERRRKRSGMPLCEDAGQRAGPPGGRSGTMLM
jgi:hypothetical protein